MEDRRGGTSHEFGAQREEKARVALFIIVIARYQRKSTGMDDWNVLSLYRVEH